MKRTESYYYQDQGTKRGVFVLPRGTLHPECPTKGMQEAQKSVSLASKRPVLTSRGQDNIGLRSPPQNREYRAPEHAPRERGWNPLDARTSPIRAR